MKKIWLVLFLIIIFAILVIKCGEIEEDTTYSVVNKTSFSFTNVVGFYNQDFEEMVDEVELGSLRPDDESESINFDYTHLTIMVQFIDGSICMILPAFRINEKEHNIIEILNTDRLICD